MTNEAPRPPGLPMLMTTEQARDAMRAGGDVRRVVKADGRVRLVLVPGFPRPRINDEVLRATGAFR